MSVSSRRLLSFLPLFLQVWGKFLSLFDHFEREHELIVSPAVFKQKLFVFLCQDVTLELKEGESVCARSCEHHVRIM